MKTKSIRKYIILTCICVLITLGLLIAIFTQDNINPNFVHAEGTLIEYTGSETEIKVPLEIKKIGSGVFKDNKFVTKIEIPESVNEIDENAFEGCRYLKEVIFQNGIKSIGKFAVTGTAIEEVYIPESVINIGVGAFSSNANLTSITVDPNNPNFTSVDGVLYNKEMTRIIIYPTGKTDTSFVVPESITEVGAYSFYYNIHLDNIKFPDNLAIIDEYAFMYSKVKEINIPQSVINIRQYAFAFCENLRNVWIADGLEIIEHSAFRDCINLLEVRLPETLIEINEFTFGECISLKKITIPRSLKIIGEIAFSGCELLEEVIVYEELEEIMPGAFSHCKSLKTINLQNVKRIGDRAFLECIALEIINISDSAVIGEDAFKDTLMQRADRDEFVIEDGVLKEYNGTDTHIYVPEGVTIIQWPFRYVKPEKLYLPSSYDFDGGAGNLAALENLKEIEIAQGNKKYKSVDGVVFSADMKLLVFFPRAKSGAYTIPDSVETIRMESFQDCTNLTSLTIPDSVKRIELFAIDRCPRLEQVNINQNITREIDDENFSSIPWENEDGFLIEDNVLIKYFGIGRTIKIPDEVKVIGEDAFKDVRNINKIIIPETVIRIEKRAFKDAYRQYWIPGITIQLPESIEYIGDEAFTGSSLSKINWPPHILKIPKNTFMGCKYLTEVSLSDNLTDIGDGAFSGCERLAAIEIPESTKIGIDAFKGTIYEDVYK